MSSHDDTPERMDADFDGYLADMKPYVLKHPNRTECLRCAMWIRKLCEPSMCGSGPAGLKNRNTYARLLLHMLRRGLLDTPFTSEPDQGCLKTLPTYMSIYLDEPLAPSGPRASSGPPVQGVAPLPDWVAGELGHRGSDRSRRSSPAAASVSRRRSYEEKTPGRDGRRTGSSPLDRSPREDASRTDGGSGPYASPDRSDLEARLNSWNLGIENPRYLRERPTVAPSPIFTSTLGRDSTMLGELGPLLKPDKEVDMKTKVLEAQHQEDKLRMQQRHDADVQKILDRKNGELEALKASYRAKQKGSEETIRKLEKKVESVLQESQVIRQSKDKQLAELRKTSDQSSSSLNNEWEKKLHVATAGVEQEKFELQRKHTESIQQILQDTDQRLAKIEAQHRSQAQVTERTVCELELTLKQQAAEVEKGKALRQKVTQEKAQLEIQVATLGAELQEASRRSRVLLKEKEEQGQRYEQALDRLRATHQADVSHYHQEHTLSAAKASEVMEALEQVASQLRQQLQEAEHQRHKQLRDQEMKFQQEKDDLKIQCEAKVLSAVSRVEAERSEAKQMRAKLEASLREAEAQLQRARELQAQQAQQAEATLEHFKKQVELSSEKTYADMKLQMEKVQEELLGSKALRENQTKEFNQQLDALRGKYEEQMAEQRVQREQERTRLQQQHAAERDGQARERQREAAALRSAGREALRQHQLLAQERRERDGQTLSELQQQVEALRAELQAAHGQRRQQLTEVAALREEERRASAQEHGAELARLRAEAQRLLADAQRSHRQEEEAGREKASSRLKQMEKDHAQKLTQSVQLIAQLQAAVSEGKEESDRGRRVLEKQLEEGQARWDQERRTLTQHADKARQALQEKVESVQRRLQSSEKKLLHKELEMQEQVTEVRQRYEGRIRGLLPAALQRDLEDTISSLKAQVNFLQKRASLLQESLDEHRSGGGRDTSGQPTIETRRTEVDQSDASI